MYVTRRYSEISKKSLAEVPEGPNLGFLLIIDVPAKVVPSCFGFCKREVVISPVMIPNNYDLTVTSREIGYARKSIILIPVLNQPLSSNRFYAIAGEGRYKGEAFTCRRKTNKHTFTRLNPTPLNPQNIYQQVEISRPHPARDHKVKSVASDGFNPDIYGLVELCFHASIPYHFELSEARGINSTLRARLPNLDCSLLSKCTKPVIVGKWYCPFMFVKEGRLRDQVERSLYYEMTLEQRWEQAYTCKKSDENLRTDSVTFEVEKEEVFIAGMCKAMCSEKNVVDDGVIWFTSYGTEGGGGGLGLGLRVEVVQRMKWEQERGGWKNGKDFKVPVKIESHKRKEEWNELGCYVLVERFNFRRMDGTEVPEGPNLGFLLIKDVRTKVVPSCFGFCQRQVVISPVMIPNNYDWTVTSRGSGFYARKSIILIPVLNQPLSSNRFYAIAGEGRYKGEAFTCSRHTFTRLNPTPLNPQNIYQQVEISHPHPARDHKVKSVASDGFNPDIYGLAELCLHASIPHHFELSEARGINSTLRARLPNLDCSLLSKCTKPVIVGKWYCPFMFVKEGRVRDQVERSLYYEMTLEQRWEQAYTCKKSDENLRTDSVTIEVEKEEVFIAGMCKAMCSEKNVTDDGVIWFTSYGTEGGGGGLGLGLRVEVVERMKWEQERGGWKNGKDFKVPVKIESHKRKEEWNELGCYVLVERFNFRRMDGSLAMTYDFKHTHQIKTIWE
ncbi:hypothetical protein ACJIZ3_009952 [Penstemon smallii]|uniref:Uncharacterized protein n=1 Tax=Penstemon smallii TaxID=265156 RepID=A0ABD3TF18_9LAMI